jgi:hypothetical protein
MERAYVQSSDLASVGYDEQSLILEIEFNAGNVYQYFGVPKDIYDGLLSASSKGKYFHQYIKKGGYSYSKIS